MFSNVENKKKYLRPRKDERRMASGSNRKLYLLYNEPEVAVNIKMRKLQSVGQINRMDDRRIPRSLLKDIV